MSASSPIPGSRSAADHHPAQIGPFLTEIRAPQQTVCRGTIASPMLRTTANQLWTRVVPAARQAYPAAGVAVSPHARSRTPAGRVMRPGRTRLFCPLPPRQSPTLTSGASPLPPQTQRTFAAAAADDDAHAVSDNPRVETQIHAVDGDASRAIRDPII